MRISSFVVCCSLLLPCTVRAQGKTPDAEELRTQVLSKLILQNQRLQDWEDLVAKTQERLKKRGAAEDRASLFVCEKLLEWMREENLANQLDLLQDRFGEGVIDLDKSRDAEDALTAGQKLAELFGDLKGHMQAAPRYLQRLETDRWGDMVNAVDRLANVQANLATQKDDWSVKARTQAKLRRAVIELRDQAMELAQPDDPKSGKAPVPKDLFKRFHTAIKLQKFAEDAMLEDKVNEKETRAAVNEALKGLDDLIPVLDDHHLALVGADKLVALEDWSKMLERAAERARSLDVKAAELAKSIKPKDTLTPAQKQKISALIGICKQVEREFNRLPPSRSAREASAPLLEAAGHTIRLLRQLQQRYATADFGPDTLQMQAKALTALEKSARVAGDLRELSALFAAPMPAPPLPSELAALGKQLDVILAEQAAVQATLTAQVKRLRDKNPK